MLHLLPQASHAPASVLVPPAEEIGIESSPAPAVSIGLGVPSPTAASKPSQPTSLQKDQITTLGRLRSRQIDVCSITLSYAQGIQAKRAHCDTAISMAVQFHLLPAATLCGEAVKREEPDEAS